MPPMARKRFVCATLICGSITGLFLCTFVFRDSFLFRRDAQVGPDPGASWPVCSQESTTEAPVAHSHLAEAVPDPLDTLVSLNGPPALTYKENLRGQIKYVTSWGSSAGWTNDVISYINLIYLGLITDRVTILPMFLSTHLPQHAGPFVFGDVFDMPRLRRALGKPVLEWREVKQTDSPVMEDIGCWNVWETVSTDGAPRQSPVDHMLNLDISYTQTPKWIKMIPNYEHDQHSTFWGLATLGFPAARSANLVPPRPSPQHRHSLPPDDHLLCYDFLYYVAAQEPFEIGLDYSPAWRYVGQHMRWTTALEQIADAYIRKTFGVMAHDPTPPFISVHARRDDFEGWCGDYSREDCFPPLLVMARRVHEVQAEIFQRKGIMVTRVIITSDEKDQAWWAQVRALGWRTPDHARTEETLGIWYPVLIDAVIQSSGLGFVGTDRSTMSILAARRVESWRDGIVRFVKWGKPGADDHDD